LCHHSLRALRRPSPSRVIRKIPSSLVCSPCGTIRNEARLIGHTKNFVFKLNIALCFGHMGPIIEDCRTASHRFFPAAWTTTSMPPKVASARLKRVSTSPGSVTSPCTAMACPPTALNSATATSPAVIQRDRAVNHSPKRWPAARSACVRACAPTSHGITTRLADRAAPCTATRSLENGFLLAASESSPRRVGQVSASGAPPHESELDGQPGIRFPTSAVMSQYLQF